MYLLLALGWLWAGVMRRRERQRQQVALAANAAAAAGACREQQPTVAAMNHYHSSGHTWCQPEG